MSVSKSKLNCVILINQNVIGPGTLELLFITYHLPNTNGLVSVNNLRAKYKNLKNTYYSINIKILST